MNCDSEDSSTRRNEEGKMGTKSPTSMTIVRARVESTTNERSGNRTVPGTITIGHTRTKTTIRKINPRIGRTKKIGTTETKSENITAKTIAIIPKQISVHHPHLTRHPIRSNTVANIENLPEIDTKTIVSMASIARSEKTERERITRNTAKVIAMNVAPAMGTI